MGFEPQIQQIVKTIPAKRQTVFFRLGMDQGKQSEDSLVCFWLLSGMKQVPRTFRSVIWNEAGAQDWGRHRFGARAKLMPCALPSLQTRSYALNDHALSTL
eukprot:1139617-Pelagomonas_calceolata.AAC.5